MKLAMYKGPASAFPHKLGHWFTCLWTRSQYSHCELVFTEPDLEGKSLCASASGRDHGVRFKRIDLDSGHWDVFEITGDPTTARDWFQLHAAQPYDWLGLVWFVLPIRAFNRPSSYFCSESIACALGLDRPHKYHPQKLLEALT